MMLSSMMKKGGVPKVEKENGELNKGMAHEAREHPWLQPAQVRRLTQDHLRENPEYYSELQEMEAHEAKEEANPEAEDALEKEEEQD